MPAQNFRPAHYNGTANDTVTKVVLRRAGHGLKIKNLDDKDSLLVSFQPDADPYTVLPGEEYNVDGEFLAFWVVASNDDDQSAAYCSIVLEG